MNYLKVTDVLKIQNGTNFAYGTPWISIRKDNTIIDTWFVGKYSSANYHVTVEFDSNQKETMQLVVLARPEHACYSIYGRTTIEHLLVRFDVTVTNNKLTLYVSPYNSSFIGSKLILTAMYSETINPLAFPTAVAVTPTTTSGYIPTVSSNFGVISVLNNQSITSSIENDTVTLISGPGIDITTNGSTKSLTIGTNLSYFKNVNVNNDGVLTPTSISNTLTFTSGTGITLTPNVVDNKMTISVNGQFNSPIVANSSLNVVGTSALHSTSIAGDLTMIGSDDSVALLNIATTGLNINKSLFPADDSTYDIGLATNKWNHVYATSLAGTLTTAAQPNITSVGTLGNLTIGNTLNVPSIDTTTIIATTVKATLVTAAQPNITSVGTLSSLSVAGNISGTLTTEAQPNITSVGTLSSLAVTGNISGTLTTATQPNITSVGTLQNPTLNNPTISNYVESVVNIGVVAGSCTINLTQGTVQTATLTASTACTFTMPTAVAGKSFILLLKQAITTGNGVATFTGVKWGMAGAPVITVAAGKMDIVTFVSDGTNWYGSISQGYTP